MTTINSTEIALHTTSGLIQYAASVEAMLAEYNRNGRFYEVRTDAAGNQVLWHKSHSRAAGTYKASASA
jgi:hypothetical protein